MEVLEASLEVAAEVGAGNYVIHSGLIRTQQGDGIEAAYGRQREWLSRAGEVARQRQADWPRPNDDDVGIKSRTV